MYTHLFVGLTLLVGAPAPKSAPPSPAPTIVGTWQFESHVNDGQPQPCPGWTIEFTANGKFVVRIDGKEEDHGAYTVDPSKDPPQTEWDPKANGNDVPGIYQVEGDTLCVCLLADPKGVRPTAFVSPAGSKYILLTLKRTKASK